jgi:hypothetical protein
VRRVCLPTCSKNSTYLTPKNLKLALEYWMDNYKSLLGQMSTSTLMMKANIQIPPKRNKKKPTSKTRALVTFPENRDEALSFACKLLVEYHHQHQRVGPKFITVAYEKGGAKQITSKRDFKDKTYLNKFYHTNKFQPYLFARLYCNDMEVNPNGYKGFIFDVDKNHIMVHQETEENPRRKTEFS